MNSSVYSRTEKSKISISIFEVLCKFKLPTILSVHIHNHIRILDNHNKYIYV